MTFFLVFGIFSSTMGKKNWKCCHKYKIKSDRLVEDLYDTELEAQISAEAGS